MYTIYSAFCESSGKVYVGQTCQGLARRKAVHYADSLRDNERYFCRAITKHGRDAFEWQELATVETKAEADNLERLWIILLRSYERDHGYNLTMGGEGCVPSEELKAKIKPRLRRGVNHPFYGKSLPELCLKRSLEVRQANGCSNETRARLRIVHGGKGNGRYRHDISDELLKQLYGSGLSVAQVAQSVGAGKTMVRTRLTKQGINPNTRGQRKVG